MLIKVIHFEIADFKAKTVQEYCMLDTPYNQELVLSHRATRSIHFGKEFDFDYARKMRIPSEFIAWSTELENELCDVDEMTGCFA